MSTEANKHVAHRLFEDVLNTGSFTALDDLFAADYVNYFPGAPAALDRPAWEQTITMFRTAFPDVHVTLEAVLADGDTVAAAFTVQGTHQGEFQGIAPTGHRVTIACQALFRFADGKIVEDRPIFDRLDLLHQLGAMPTAGHTVREVGA